METEKTYAIKVVDRTNFSHAEDAAVLNEVALLKSLRHKHIVPLLDFFEDPVSKCFNFQLICFSNVLSTHMNIRIILRLFSY